MSPIDDRDAATVLAGLLSGQLPVPARVRLIAREVEIEIDWVETTPRVPSRLDQHPVEAVAPDLAVPEPGRVLVLAETVGTFYSAPQQGAEPFVSPGDPVAVGQQIGIIEAMKLMMPVEADTAGRIVEVLVADGCSIDYGEALFAVEPAGG